MKLTEELLSGLVKTVCGSLVVEYQGRRIDFTPPFRRMRIKEAILTHWPENVPRPTEADLISPEKLPRLLEAVGSRVDRRWNLGQMLGKLFEHVAEENLIQPTFIIEYPTEMSPLSKQSEDDPSLVHRFELYVGGLEVANAFCELNDPAEQRRRFEQQMQLREQGDEEAMVMDEDYIRALSFGMPPAAGEGIGIDRLVMILTDQKSIRDVILFPHRRPEV
jgi:lysyl-tRNA synthetase class 2